MLDTFENPKPDPGPERNFQSGLQPHLEHFYSGGLIGPSGFNSREGEHNMLGRQQTRWLLAIGFCIAVISMTSIVTFAQDITSGTIQGTISDEQGAVVAGATVEARNVDTNFTRSFSTDEDGR